MGKLELEYAKFMKKNEWFKTWFNSPFYHILYQHRDLDEAEAFISTVLDEFTPPKEAKIMDLACGKGRHAYFIAKQGYQVYGLDLAPESIQYAKQHFSLNNLHFYVHDMRDKFGEHNFDYIFNFFTSFGYFENLADNRKVLESMDSMLKPGGTVLIDFLNVPKVVAHLVPEEIKTLDGIDFHLSRKIQDGFIYKDIKFSYEEQNYAFQERVQALGLDDFKSLIKHTNFSLDSYYGNYYLEPYNEEIADRLIIVLKKH